MEFGVAFAVHEFALRDEGKIKKKLRSRVGSVKIKKARSVWDLAAVIGQLSGLKRQLSDLIPRQRREVIHELCLSSFHVNRRWGDSNDDPSVAQMREALAELDIDDDEHPEVALIHESGWCLGAYPSGLLIWEDLSTGCEPRHMRGVSRNHVLELWQSLARGDIVAVDAEPWQPGNGAGITAIWPLKVD